MPCKNERTPQKIEHMPEDISIVFLFEFPTRGGQKEMMSENVCRELLLIQTPTSLSLSPTCIGCCFIVMENAYIHACMHMHGIAAYGGWGSCMVCGVTTPTNHMATPTNHMAKVESPPKDSRGVRKKERCLCTFSLGAGWLGTIVYRSTSACWQCTLHVYRLVAKQAAAAHAHLDMDLVACMHACMMHVCFSSILGAGFAPNTYQTTVQPKRFSLTLTFSISQIRCFG
jgi:hypothetical protein